MTRTPAAFHSAAPDAGEHSDAILGEAGLSADEISTLRAKGVV
jgi:crotonobetainyl-CoA:carnitine CoA-transferase CaiB-like acyl-CoA transferase